jgi:hypothetical protein
MAAKGSAAVQPVGLAGPLLQPHSPPGRHTLPPLEPRGTLFDFLSNPSAGCFLPFTCVAFSLYGKIEEANFTCKVPLSEIKNRSSSLGNVCFGSLSEHPTRRVLKLKYCELIRFLSG